eukprot:SAG22_NODE_1514_length_4253_cov_1.546943_2_plen_344_part_00
MVDSDDDARTLPAGWLPATSRTTGKTYYFNLERGESSYDWPGAETGGGASLEGGGGGRGGLEGSGSDVVARRPVVADSESTDRQVRRSPAGPPQGLGGDAGHAEGSEELHGTSHLEHNEELDETLGSMSEQEWAEVELMAASPAKPKAKPTLMSWDSDSDWDDDAGSWSSLEAGGSGRTAGSDRKHSPGAAGGATFAVPALRPAGLVLNRGGNVETAMPPLQASRIVVEQGDGTAAGGLWTMQAHASPYEAVSVASEEEAGDGLSHWLERDTRMSELVFQARRASRQLASRIGTQRLSGQRSLLDMLVRSSKVEAQRIFGGGHSAGGGGEALSLRRIVQQLMD